MAEGLKSKLKSLFTAEDYDEDEEYEEEEVKAVPQPKYEPRVSAPAASKAPAAGIARETKPFKMVVIEPAGFDDCPRLVDSLKARKPVIINLEKVESDMARKIFDFLSGATYALSGNVQKISTNIFVFAPETTEINAMNEREVTYTEVPKSPWR